MTKEAMRFLALNAVLHGHPAVAAFEDSTKLMAECLGVDEQEASSLSDAMYQCQPEDIVHDELTGVFLNFYRNGAYTFVAMGSDIIPLQRFVQNDLEGQVSDELRYLYLSHLMHDVSQDATHMKPCILDGVLYCTPEAFLNVNTAMQEAYQLYLTGPVGTPKGLSTPLRKYTTMEQYSRLNESTLLKIFRQLVRTKHNPSIYQKTMLCTPDLLTTYKRTGCIMAFRDSSHTTVNWLMDVEGEADSTLMMVADMSVLRNYLLRDVKDLSGIKVSRGRGESGKILFPEVV